jgi:hypothetical protein
MLSRLPYGLLFLIFSLISPATPALAQRHRSNNLDENIQIPSDYAIDYQLSLGMRGQVHGSSSLLTDTPMNLAGDTVFQKLVNDTSVRAQSVPYRWNFTIVNDDSINASSLPDGEICVGSGLAKLIGTNSGLWAAALSHETEHAARRHWVKKYLFEVYVQQQFAYYQALVAAGDNNANWSIVGLRIAAPIARARLSRNLEHDADIQGMMLMANEGYHPDNVFALHHLLRAATGEQSKFSAFFSTHPRWETRDQRDDKAYSDALGKFNQLWPDASASPGGVPPLVAFAGKPSVQENRQNKTADLMPPIYCRNATEPVVAIIFFQKDHKLVKSDSQEYSDTKGDLVFRQQFECNEKSDASPVAVHLPATLVTKDNRKVEAFVGVFSKDGDFLDEFKAITVHFPKP